MSIYRINGVALSDAFSVDGNALSAAYDISGELVFPDETALKVMSYNVQWFTKINAQQGMQNIIINGNAPNIIGFQEISQNGTIPSVGVNVLTQYPTKKLSNHKNYLAMASKLPLSNYIINDFENQDPEDLSRYNETRAYMVADVSYLGRTIKWINTHLSPLTQSYRWLQMGEIFTIASGYVSQDYPVILTGDFNSNATSVEDGDYINMYKQFVDAGYHMVNSSQESGFTKTFSSLTTATSLADLTKTHDNIIVSPDITIESVLFDTTKFSYLNGDPIDHIAVVAVLTFQ